MAAQLPSSSHDRGCVAAGSSSHGQGNDATSTGSRANGGTSDVHRGGGASSSTRNQPLDVPDRATGDSGVLSNDHQELGPVCSGALALRRITSLLSSARKADSKGDRAQAREQYTEILKLQESLARAPLGSIGKSLQEAVVWVEKRLQYLERRGKTGADDSGRASRPPTMSTKPSSSPSTRYCDDGKTMHEFGARTGLGDARPLTREDTRLKKHIEGRSDNRSSRKLSSLDGFAQSSPRERFSQPVLRDGLAQPSPRDGAVRPPRDRFARAPSRDGVAQNTPRDCVARPFSREAGYLQNTPRDGAARPSPRDAGVRRQEEFEESPRPSTRGASPRGLPCPTAGESSQRPPTRDGLARPPTRTGPGDRRAQDVTIRRASTKTSQRGFQVMDGAVAVASPSPRPSPRPCKSHDSTSDSEASIELL